MGLRRRSLPSSCPCCPTADVSGRHQVSARSSKATPAGIGGLHASEAVAAALRARVNCPTTAYARDGGSRWESGADLQPCGPGRAVSDGGVTPHRPVAGSVHDSGKRFFAPAVFGQPEIKLGVIPGIGGSQRLTRAVGKAKAMELCLTGRTMDAAEAERAGLVSRVVAADDLLGEALAVAETVAGMSLPVAMMAKEAVVRAFETTLAEGVRSNGASSTRRSPPATRRRAWVLLSTSGHPSSVTGERWMIRAAWRAGARSRQVARYWPRMRHVDGSRGYRRRHHGNG